MIRVRWLVGRDVCRITLGVALALGLAVTLSPASPDPVAAQQAPAPINATLPSCDPRILHMPYGSGPTEASGAGVATAPRITLTDTDGMRLPDTSGTIAWSFRALVRESSGPARPSHDIGGFLNLDITTAAGHRISFRAHCIAGAGTLPVPPALSTDGYTLLYANGIATGWPSSQANPRQGAGARQAFVHFEAIRYTNGQIEIYVAVVDGQDCAVNHRVLIVTAAPDYAIGGGSYSAANRASYTETDCSLLGGPGRSLPPGPRRP